MLALNCKHRRDPRTAFRYYADAKQRLDALREADVSVAYSAAVERHLRANGIMRVHTVPLSIRIPARTNPIPSNGRRVVYAGRLTPVKGVGVLLTSARQFDADLDICGDGPSRPALERMVERLRISHRVTFHGWCDAGKLDSIYDHASIIVVPSVYPEPFGMVGPEAMAKGRPVVASWTGGTSEWLQDGRNGIAAPPGNPKVLGQAIRTLLADPERLEQMGSQARADVLERFSDAAHVAALLEAYGAAIDRAEPRLARPSGR
jgi:glycosyltransferase involved in cell wall biosynthesis